jgi:hypothetical protein
MASLLSSLDVYRYRRSSASRESMGVFHWLGSRWFMGLHKYFRNKLFFDGLHQISQWIQSGHLQRPDLAIAVAAWFSNLFVVIGCVWAYSRLSTKPLSDAGRFVVVFAVTTGFFALDMALFQPRYLGLFPRMLHPHLP